MSESVIFHDVPRPTDAASLRRAFGDPAPYLRADGTVMESLWFQSIMGGRPHERSAVRLPAPLAIPWTDMAIERITVHHLLVPAYRAALEDLAARDLWRHLSEFGGCYCWRRQRGGTKLSVHAWAAAIDFNPSTNRLGEDGDMHQGVVEVMESHGFAWGGRWRRRDCGHFQFCDLSY